MRKRQSVKNKTNSRVNGDEFKRGGNSVTVLLLLLVDPLSPLQLKDVTNVPVIIPYLSSLQTPQR